MTLLSICQDAAKEIGVPSPSTVIGSTDTTNIQLLAAANREGKNGELRAKDNNVSLNGPRG